jgi:hypothetical protein
MKQTEFVSVNQARNRPLAQAPSHQKAGTLSVAETKSRDCQSAPPVGRLTQTAAFEPQQHPDSRASIDFRVEELRLSGFKAADRYAIGDAFERELARLFQERGIPTMIGEQIEIGDINGGALALERGLDAETIGHELARSVYEGLSP